MLSQNLRDLPNVVERVIKRCRRSADDIWFVEIAIGITIAQPKRALRWNLCRNRTKLSRPPTLSS
jgi:hypothetical protein